LAIRYLWWDHRSKENVPFLPGLKELIGLFNAEDVGDIPVESKSNRIYFVHPGDNQTAWEVFANNDENVNVHIMFASSQPDSLKSACSTIYCIKQPLPSIAKYLKDNPAKLKTFKISCDLGTPDWAAFEPVNLSRLIAISILCQGYLAVHGSISQKGFAISEDKRKGTNNADWWEPAFGNKHIFTDTDLYEEITTIDKNTKFNESSELKDDTCCVTNVETLFNQVQSGNVDLNNLRMALEFIDRQILSLA